MRKEQSEKYRLYALANKHLLAQEHVQLLSWYLEDGWTQQAIARHLDQSIHVTREQISKALYELRKVSDDPEYLKAKKILYPGKES